LRRVVNGQELAPKALRKKGKRFLSSCTEEELKNVLGVNDLSDAAQMTSAVLCN
jgi:hypothetical protein